MSSESVSLSGQQESLDAFEGVNNLEVVNGVQVSQENKEVLEEDKKYKDTTPNRNETSYRSALSGVPIPKEKLPIRFRNISKEMALNIPLKQLLFTIDTKK